MKRRDALKCTVASLVPPLIAGCQSINDLSTEEDMTSEIRELQKNTPPRDLECGGENLNQIEMEFSDSLPTESSDFELTSSKDRIHVGEEIRFSLRNVTKEPQGLGTIYKYTIQKQNNGSWNHIYQTTEEAWIDIGVTIQPEGGYDWPFTFNHSGLERSLDPAEYHVCSSLNSGIYRFVYWGTTGEALAKRFQVDE